MGELASGQRGRGRTSVLRWWRWLAGLTALRPGLRVQAGRSEDGAWRGRDSQEMTRGEEAHRQATKRSQAKRRSQATTRRASSARHGASAASTRGCR
ncbi:hypothetical protein ACFPN7_05215 [Amycolatopsis halotolerans]|uniref:hypothetical protein n=1 Tax=Amycolatopsis halotolerans TaxID=330083 RepID=UPI00361C0CB1